MNKGIVKDVSDSMVEDIRLLSKKFEEDNVGFSSTMRKVRDFNPEAIKRVMSGSAVGIASFGSVLGFAQASLLTMTDEPNGLAATAGVVSAALAVGFGMVLDKLTEEQLKKVPDDFLEFRKAHRMKDSEVKDLIKNSSLDTMVGVSGVVDAFRASESYTGNSPTRPKMK